MKRYQVYLSPHSVSILDETATMSDFSRSQLIREAVDATASRLGNLLAAFKPVKREDYSWIDTLVGATKVRGKKIVSLSENVDEIIDEGIL